MDDELSNWVWPIRPSGAKKKAHILNTVYKNKEPKLHFLVIPVYIPAGQEWEGEPEGRNEMQQPLPHHASAKLLWVKQRLADHQHKVKKDKHCE